MAVAPELVEAGAAGAEGGAAEATSAPPAAAARKAPARRSSSSTTRSSTSGTRSSTPAASSGRSGGRPITLALPGGRSSSSGIPRVVFALAAGILALELGAYLTGQSFSWDLQVPWSRVRTAGQYLGLYPGQQQHLAQLGTSPAPAPASSPVLMPGIFPNTNLSGRAGGNLAVGP